MAKRRTKQVKRHVYLASRFEKVVAVRRVLNGESKADVRKTSGIPEATLRGWCKKEEIVAAAKDGNADVGPPVAQGANAAVAPPPPPVVPLVPARNDRSNKTVTKNGASTSGNNKSRAKSSSRDKLANRSNKTTTKNGASTSGNTKSRAKSSSGDKLANRCNKTRTGTESGNDSGVEDLSDASNANDPSINKTKRATKRKRIHTDNGDAPTKRRIVDANEKVTISSENQQVNDLEARNGKDLVYDLFVKDIITRDTFIYFWETMKSLEF